MFDIRSALLRSIGYTLTISVIVGVYVVIIVGLAKIFLPNHKLDALLEAYFIVPALFSYVFRPIARLHRKSYREIFFRDSFDPEELLNKIGQVLPQKSA